ncbi:hypothetical protein C7B80_30040 [Cyanosarcina cf. burmensis CCALA 770]|nr:hypothetical protein C7B80_30040 [Cyanosarcina cf. burmensis CCALA 770]
MESSLKKLIDDRMAELGWNPYKLAIAYGKIKDPDFQGTDRDIGNKNLSRIRTAIAQPERCQLDTLKTIFQALGGSPKLTVEFIEEKQVAI